MHVQPGTPCFACHQLLDPMRDFYKQSYSLTYFEQLSTLIPRPRRCRPRASSTWTAPRCAGRGVATLAKAMAEHPLFATAWTQKVCQLANASHVRRGRSRVRAGGQRLQDQQLRLEGPAARAAVLAAGHLRRAAPRPRTRAAWCISIARRDNYCDRLGNRLGIHDLLQPEGREHAAPGAAQAATCRWRSRARPTPAPTRSR